jgi:hypothetical protein
MDGFEDIASVDIRGRRGRGHLGLGVDEVDGGKRGGRWEVEGASVECLDSGCLTRFWIE